MTSHTTQTESRQESIANAEPKALGVLDVGVSVDRLRSSGPSITWTGYLTQRAIQRSLDRLVAMIEHRKGELVLDLGCGNRPYQWMIPDARWIGLNPVTQGAEPDLIGDALSLPVKDATLDGVLATQVLEHVRRPWVALEEISRCLKPGGWCIVTIPMAWRLHEEPWDFWRFTRYGFAGMAEDVGLEVVDIREDLPAFQSILNSVLHLFAGKIFAPLRLVVNLVGTATLPLCRSSHYSTNLSCLLRRPL
ncbi:MAG: hypothetical protein RL173_1630 [Fibrobacterota bacterium]